MAQQAVAQHAISIRLACKAFGISETCYRYQANLSDDNALIAEQLICQRHSKIDPFDLVLSFNLWLNPYSFFILQTITLTRYLYHMTVIQ